MPQPNVHTISVDLSRIDNAEVRRAMRQLVMQLQETIALQQAQIEALLELITEKHVASLSEFRRAMQQLIDRKTERLGRIHSEVAHAASTPPVQNPLRNVDEPEENGHKIYRL